MPHQEDAFLLARLRTLDAEALAEVYDAFSPAVYAYALRLLGDSELAEECVAETFYRLLKALQNGGGPVSGLKPYLYRVAHNWITDQYRKKPLNEVALEEVQIPAADPPLDRQTEQRHLAEQTRLALRSLTEEQRLVVSLRFIEGFDLEEVAQVVGKPLSAVKALQHRGLQALRRMLIGKESEEDG